MRWTDSSYLGFMRFKPEDFAGTFEYWIGMFFPPDTQAPGEYRYIDVSAGKVAVGWILGTDDGYLYAKEKECEVLFTKKWGERRAVDAEGYCYRFERYNCPRFTTVDEQNNVILDYCAYIG